jgi:hypothetical protein
MRLRVCTTFTLTLASFFLAACAQLGGGSSAKSDAGAQTSSAPKVAAVPPGMNTDGEVVGFCGPIELAGDRAHSHGLP